MSCPVRGEGPALVETLRVRALPEGGSDDLLEFLRLYRDAVQTVVDRTWGTSDRLSIKTLHKLFYKDLVSTGFRAHHAKEIYVYAKSVVKSAKGNGDRRPTLRRLTARLDRYDYRLDLDDMTLTLKLHRGREARLRLIAPKERAEKFRGWENYELAIKYDRDGLWVTVYFRRGVKPAEPRTVMSVDLNFDNITLAVFTLNGKLIRLKRLRTPLRKALTHRIWAERIQRRYPRSWRFTKGVRRAVERHGERIKNISWDYTHKAGDLIAELALRYRSAVVLEDLNGLREDKKRGRDFNKRLALWFYRRAQFCVEYEAKERGLQVAKVDPRGTSSRCPRCGLEGDRDVIATINIYRRYVSVHSRCGAPGVALSAPKPDESPSGVRGNRDEAMTVRQHEPVWELNPPLPKLIYGFLERSLID
ncbi:IS200/IS605 family accessory protein TnpB-related protein [Acidilobus sp. 7A]|uniref:IS200/IS605 family accessory protein TnpB-related protein n=1 Tax=Acidilobus sp. 7A TaxID=1577685 RepID=UPI0013143F85|nr:IS200/IS605 family accessory protein TnpB-related protein [Acidilobus sp. 7A]